MKRLIRFAIPLAMLSPTFALGGIVCIVNKDNPLASATKEQLNRVFLGKAQSIENSGTLITLDVDTKSAARKDFMEIIIEKSEPEFKKYNSRMVFTGKGTPAKIVGGDSDVIKMVADNKSAIGCVDDGAQLPDSVKAVFKK